MAILQHNEDAQWPLVSVIIPVYNSKESLDTLLPALEKQSLARNTFEVIVVDDDSSEDVVGHIQTNYPKIRAIRQKRGGSYVARNTGVAASLGDILVFTDADCIPDPGWLRNGLDALNNRGADVVAGGVTVDIDDPHSVVQRYDARFNLKQSFYAILGFGVTANLFVKKDVYTRVGGFDSTLYSGGDQRFCQLAILNGARFHYIEDALVFHPARKYYKELYRKTIRVAKGRAMAFHKNNYYFPRLLFLLPEAYQDKRFKTEPISFRLRFIALHYVLEACRIFVYVRTRIMVGLEM
ncbi:MAG: glycosyltransferase [Candidatus Marinimicrobia bacterium]|nr:glycosyltransferase [Candidatus Neomarinimicrobiota bacterium]